MWKEFCSGLLIPRDLDSGEAVATILRVLEETAPSLIPQRCGFTEPLSVRYQPGETHKQANLWESGDLIWTSKLCDGQLMPSAHHHSHLVLSKAPMRLPIDVSELKRFYRHLGQHFPVDFGYIHFANEETQRKSQWTRGLLIPSVTAKDYLPYVPWGILFGEPYIELIGRDRLLASPVALAEEWSDSLIYLQLSERLEDVGSDIEKFETRQSDLKGYLGEQLFFRPNVPKSQFLHPYFKFMDTDRN